MTYRRETTVPDELVATDSGSVVDSLVVVAVVVFCVDGVDELSRKPGTRFGGGFRLRGIFLKNGK